MPCLLTKSDRIVTIDYVTSYHPMCRLTHPYTHACAHSVLWLLGGLRSIAISVFVCLSARVSQKPLSQNYTPQYTNYTEFLKMLSVALAYQFSSDDNVLYTSSFMNKVIFRTLATNKRLQRCILKLTHQGAVPIVLIISLRCNLADRCALELSNSGKKSFDSIRFGNLINLPLVHWYSNSKLGVIFIVCIA